VAAGKALTIGKSLWHVGNALKIGNRPVASQPLQKGPAITKGWVCGVAEEDSDWLGSSTGPHTNEVWTGKVEQQGFDLLWVQVTTSAECKKVSGYSLFWEGAANATGKEPIEALINM
jgi:hypothetical protein